MALIMTRFVSKRDTWLLVIMWTVVIMVVAVGVLSLMKGAWFGALMGIAVAALGLWTTYGTFYDVGQDVLLVRCGPFRWRIPLDSITNIEETDDPLASPACSLDRLAVTFGEDRILVSPRDKAGFIAAVRR
jgi:hypothetical protein